MESLLPERSANFYSVLSIRHLHISHNAPYFSPKFCLIFVFLFLLGITAVPGEIENNAYAKFWGAI